MPAYEPEEELVEEELVEEEEAAIVEDVVVTRRPTLNELNVQARAGIAARKKAQE